MYEQFYGLRERPFDLTPNPRYLFLTGQHREALSNIQYGIAGRKGITLLVGEAGTGKTTLVRAALSSLELRGVHCVCVNNPALTRGEFYEFLSASFGFTREAASSKARFLIELEEHVLRRHLTGGTTALLIDEAQSLHVDLLEEVRLLANLETVTAKLMPLVLVGQPELAAKLDEPQHRQLKQRVALRCDLAPLTIQETAAYIAGRIRIAGGDVTAMFTRDAVELIYRRSRGIPRTISVLCDNALVTGFAAGVKPVGRDIVLEVCRDFRIGTADTGPQPVAAPPPHSAGAPRPDARVFERQPPTVPKPEAAAAEPAKADPPAAVARRPEQPPPSGGAAGVPVDELVARLRARGQPPAQTADKPERDARRERDDQLFQHFSRRRRFLF
jgi:general secretion pathway protein A